MSQNQLQSYATNLQQRFSNEEISQLFVNQGIDLEVLSASPQSRFQLHTIDENADFQRYVSFSRTEEDLIYFVRKDYSWGRLKLTSDAFIQLLESEKVFTPYSNLVKRFGSKVKDDNNVRLSFHALLSTNAINGNHVPVCEELCYNVHHVERNGRNRGDPWSLRQTGIYHQIDLTTKRSSWIFIQASGPTRDEILRVTKADEFRENSMLLHLDVLFSMAQNWPEYIEYLSSKLDDLDEKASFSKIGEKAELDYYVKFSDCQRLHLLRTKLSTTLHALQSCREAAQGVEARYHVLQGHGILPFSGSEVLENIKRYEKEITTYCKSVEAILERSLGTSTLLSKILEFTGTKVLVETSHAIQGNIVALEAISLQSQEESRILRKLAQQTEKDSIALKILTFIATVYLPASLIATIFSSNLIQTSSDNSHFIIAKEFWVFVLATLGLMIITIMSFVLLQHRWSRGLNI